LEEVRPERSGSHERNCCQRAFMAAEGTETAAVRAHVHGVGRGV
jgi:hypothetical protein